KLFALAHELQVTTPTVASDLDEVERWAARDGLSLIRRRGYGVELEGDEVGKRRAIVRLAQESLDDSDLFGRAEADDGAPHPVTAKLLELIGKPSFFRLEQALWANEAARPNASSEAAYTRRLLRLSVAFARYRAGHRVEARPGPSVPEEAAALARTLARELELDLPPEEASYVASVLADDTDGGGVNGDGDGLPSADPRLLETAASLIRGVERRLNVSLAGDRQLREGLLQHLEPALARLREGGPIRNPLLAQIKRDYESLYRDVKDAAEETLGAQGLTLPDEEAGFLAMHFGAALERGKQLPGAVRALLVCTSGIGSSKMLAVRLAKEFPQVDVVGSVSWYEAAHMPQERYDLIVSTVDLPLPPERYVKLSPLLNAEETDRLRRFLRGAIDRDRPPVAKSGAGPPPEGAAGDEDATERLRALRQYADGAVRLLDRFAVRRLATAGKPLRALLLEACRSVLPGDAGEEVADRLLERERQGSLLLPDTDLALFHTRSAAVDGSTLALFRLDREVDTGADRPVSRFLLMLAPKRLPKRELELLSEVSAMLLQPDFVEALRVSDEAHIVRYMAEQLENYIKNQFEWSE
ncbi:MAG TPA: BglG family transcription antiterminator, partial [Paenibacillus sp.]|nr:BglG family transcription antiterminator [Paenibacillus sp.]